MHGAYGQHHPVSRFQLEVFALAFQDKGDRAVHAVQNLLVGVTVGGITVARAVRPRVAAASLGAQPIHQIVEAHSESDSIVASMWVLLPRPSPRPCPLNGGREKK